MISGDGRGGQGVIDRRTFLRVMPRRMLEGMRGLLTEAATLGVGLSPRPEPARGRRVAILDISSCLAWGAGECQLCYLRCPLRDEAIVLEAGKPTIAASACDGCGVCVDVCRTVNDRGAINMLPLPASWHDRGR